MKFKHLLMATLFTGALASCSDDLAMDGGDKVLENQTTTYVRLSIIGDNATRADVYEDGTADENAVNSILLTFFDSNYNYVGYSDKIVGTPTALPGDPSHTIEKKLQVIAEVNLPEDANVPHYVIAYVNPTRAALSTGDLITENLSDAMKVIRDRDDVSHNGFRTMNNSVYFAGGANDNVRYATEVNFKDNFFTTKEAAEAATDGYAIDVYVERMEAKVELETSMDALKNKVNKVSGDNVDGVADYELTFVPEAWFVNGTEKRSFLLKNFRSDADGRKNYLTGNMTSNDKGFTLTGLTNAFLAGGHTSITGLNNADNRRSFWAIDPTYFYATTSGLDFYPDVSYDINEYENAIQKPDWDKANYPLEYRSYYNVLNKEYKNGSTNYLKFNDDNEKTHEYVLENTVSKATLASTDAKAALTSVVILGHYVIKNKAGETVFDGSVTDTDKVFYIRHDSDTKKTVLVSETEGVSSDNAVIDYFLETGNKASSIFYVQKRDEAGNVITGTGAGFEQLTAAHLYPEKSNGVNYGITHSDFTLEYPNQYADGAKPSEQWRTLRVAKRNGSYNDNIYVYNREATSEASRYVKLSSLSAAQVNDILSRMYSSFGVVERFESGKAYFNVPLRHLWADFGDNDKNAENLAQAKLGAYGVVRNHIYRLGINSISGLGTGIGDITQPIVPPTEPDKYFVKVRLNILQWRLVTQSVNL